MGQILDHFRDNKKDLISIIFLIILIFSLPFAFKLAKDRQIFSSKASDSPIKVLDTNIKLNGNVIETDSPTLNLQITSPLEIQETSDAGFQLIKTAYAENVLVDSPINRSPTNDVTIFLTQVSDSIKFDWTNSKNISNSGHMLVIYRGAQRSRIEDLPVKFNDCGIFAPGLIYCKQDITNGTWTVPASIFDSGDKVYSWYITGRSVPGRPSGYTDSGVTIIKVRNLIGSGSCDGKRDQGGFRQKCDLTGSGKGDGVQWCVGGLHSDDPNKEPYKCMADPTARIGSTCYPFKSSTEWDTTKPNDCGQIPVNTPASPPQQPPPSTAPSAAPVPSSVPSPAPSAPPAGSNGWIKAQCNGGQLLSTCKLPGGADCSEWGKDEEPYRLAGWNEDEYKRCRDFCTELRRNGGVHARACIVPSAAPVPSSVPSPAPSAPPAVSNRWVKASCSNGIFRGCHLPGDAHGCANWGLDTEAFRLAGWTEDEYNKCRVGCTTFYNPNNKGNESQAACRVLSSFNPSPAPSVPSSPNSPSRDKYISGKIVQQVYISNDNSCRISPLERIKVSIYEEGQEKMDTFTGADGVFNYTVKSDKTYTITIPDKSTVVVETDGSWDEPGNDCGENCNFTFNRNICKGRSNSNPSPSPRLQPRVLEQVRQTAEFRISENRTHLSDPEWGWTAYTRGGVRYPFSFTNMAPGQSRTIFVQFRDHEKQLITDSTHTNGIYILNVRLKAPASSPPVSVAPSVVPTPVPTAVPPPPPADNCVLGEPGVASYPGEAGSKEWCDCANNNKDYGSQINYNCPAVQCQNLVATNSNVCGGRISTYDNCTPKCVNGKRIYVCFSSKNQNCTTEEAGVECSLEDSQCQAPQPVQDTCATSCGACPAATDRCGNYVYTGGCDYSTCKSSTDTYKCVAPGNSACVGINLPCGSVCGGGSGTSGGGSSDVNGEP